MFIHEPRKRLLDCRGIIATYLFVPDRALGRWMNLYVYTGAKTCCPPILFAGENGRARVFSVQAIGYYFAVPQMIRFLSFRSPLCWKGQSAVAAVTGAFLAPSIRVLGARRY